MSEHFYRLPGDLARDIDEYQQEVSRFQAGALPASIFKARRVPRGVYEQRRNGTYMLRVRVAGGTLAAEQVRELAALCPAHGGGALHITTRQDVQFHDLAIEHTPSMMRRLLRVGLTTKGGGGNTVRNITVCPLAGICRRECFDVTPAAHAVTEYLLPLVGSYNLPRKYKIAFSGCAADCALAQVADLGFVAAARGGVPGFRVVGGGGMGGHSRVADEWFDWVPATEAVRVAEAVRRVFDQLGDRNNRQRARLRHVAERLGPDALRDRVRQQTAAVAEEGVPAWSGPQGVQPAAADPAAGEAALEEDRHGLRVIPQRQAGFVAVSLQTPLGLLRGEDFARLGDLAERFSEERGLRTTRRQGLLLRFVREERLADLASALGALQADVRRPGAIARFVACAGASTCRLGLCLARGAAQAGAEALDRAGLEPGTLAGLEFHINGCPNACGQQPVGPVGASGAALRSEGRLVPAYRVTVGGGCGADGARLGTFIGQVPARALPALLRELAADFQARRQADEPFARYAGRAGLEHFQALARRHESVPSYAEQPEFYRDYGADGDFSLAGRGAGECGAGVFEVIREDLNAARQGKATMEILVPAARALLITRGVDAQDPETVLREFEKHFIDPGLVAERFRSLLACARGGGCTPGAAREEGCCAGGAADLLEEVERLYATLDSNLQFHPPSPPPACECAAPEPNAAAELDLRGVPCPMNFVKAKLRLEAMDAGSTLAVTLDDGEPVRNVPASLRGEGHEVLEMTDLRDGHWRVVVRKGA